MGEVPASVMAAHSQVEGFGTGVVGAARLAPPQPRGQAVEPVARLQIGHCVV